MFQVSPGLVICNWCTSSSLESATGRGVCVVTVDDINIWHTHCFRCLKFVGPGVREFQWVIFASLKIHGLRSH